MHLLLLFGEFLIRHFHDRKRVSCMPTKYLCFVESSILGVFSFAYGQDCVTTPQNIDSEGCDFAFVFARNQDQYGLSSNLSVTIVNNHPTVSVFVSVSKTSSARRLNNDSLSCLYRFELFLV